MLLTHGKINKSEGLTRSAVVKKMMELLFQMNSLTFIREKYPLSKRIKLLL